MGVILLPPLFEVVVGPPPVQYGDPVWVECSLSQQPVRGIARDVGWSVVQTKDPYDHDAEQPIYFATVWRLAQYYNRRSGFIFDTSPVPADGWIQDAYFYLYDHFTSWGGAPYQDCHCRIVDASTWDGGHDLGAYAEWNGLTDVVAEWTILTTDGPGYRKRYLNANGFTKIVRGGLTKYVGMTEKDLSNTDPGATSRDYHADPLAAGAPGRLWVQYRPKL